MYHACVFSSYFSLTFIYFTSKPSCCESYKQRLTFVTFRYYCGIGLEKRNTFTRCLYILIHINYLIPSHVYGTLKTSDFYQQVLESLRNLKDMISFSAHFMTWTSPSPLSLSKSSDGFTSSVGLSGAIPKAGSSAPFVTFPFHHLHCWQLFPMLVFFLLIFCFVLCGSS